MMNYDRTLIEAQKTKVQLPQKKQEKDYGTFFLIGLIIVVVVILLFG